jgi:hypothetical protein
MDDKYIELIIDEKIELFEPLLRFRFKGNDYISLSPKDDDESAAIFEIKKADNDEELFCTIENENLAKEVFVHFVSLWELTEDEQ